MTTDDPDLKALEESTPAHGGTVFDRLAAELGRREEMQAETVTYVLTQWPDWEVTYRLPATAAEISALSKASAGKRKKDIAATNRLLLSRCCVGLRFAGEDMLEDDGTPMTWASPRVRQILKAAGSTEALTTAYRGGIPDGPGDGELTAHADDLVSRAGFGDDSQIWTVDKDPTQGR